VLGFGALAGARVDARSIYPVQLRREAFAVFHQGWAAKANEALGGTTKVEEIRAVGFAVLEFLDATDHAAVPEFVREMSAGGEKLDDVIRMVLNGTRDDLLNHTATFIATHYGP
jgi:hypothetical protein